MPKSAALAIGIDLGTTYSCVGVFQNGKVEIIANDQGSRTTPSYVAFSETEWFAGEVAKSQSLRNPKNTVFDAKRMLGRGFHDEELRRDMKRWPFKVIDDRGIPKIEVQYKNKTKLFTPVEISSMVLTKMKMTAEAYLGKTVTKAVITVPAYFTNAQRQATKDAGKIAGLDVMRIINEPTAAVLAYGLDKKLDEEQKVLIFDLGGGTFDVSVLAYADQVFQVMATAGDTHLGGEDFDHRLVEHFANEFKRQHKKDPRTSSLAMRRLKVACEEAKRTLSSTSVAHVNVDSLLEGIDFAGKVSRARFDELCGDLFRKTLDTVQSALDDANLKRTDIDEVILVGGSTRIPKVRKLLQDFFDGKKLNLRINADEAVAFGATVQAATLSGQEVPGVDLLIDVIPYSLGVREGENNFAKFIERNSHVPIRVEKEFVLGRDYQTAAQVDIYEGEHPNARNNHLLGEFLLDGLPAMKRGETKLKIVYDVDADGIMTVSAKDTMSGKSKEIQVNCMSYIGPEELKKMQENAARMAAEAKAEEERRRGEDEEEQFTTSWEGDGPRDDERSEARGKSDRSSRELDGGFMERKDDTSPQAGRKRSKDRKRKSDSSSADDSDSSGRDASRNRRSGKRGEKRRSDDSTHGDEDGGHERRKDKRRETKQREKDAERKGNKDKRRKSESSPEGESDSSESDASRDRRGEKRGEEHKSDDSTDDEKHRSHGRKSDKRRETKQREKDSERKGNKDRRRKSESSPEGESDSSESDASRDHRGEKRGEARKSDDSTDDEKDRSHGRKSDKQRETKEREKDTERKGNRDRRRRSDSSSEDDGDSSRSDASRARRSERKDEKRKSDDSTDDEKDRNHGRKSDKQRETKELEKDTEHKGNRDKRRRSDSSSEGESDSSESDASRDHRGENRDEKRKSDDFSDDDKDRAHGRKSDKQRGTKEREKDAERKGNRDRRRKSESSSESDSDSSRSDASRTRRSEKRDEKRKSDVSTGEDQDRSQGRKSDKQRGTKEHDEGRRRRSPSPPHDRRSRHPDASPKRSDQSEEHKDSDEDEKPSTDKVGNDLLLTIENLLEGEPNSSKKERQEVRRRCLGLLAQVATNPNKEIRSRARDLRRQLDEKYGKAGKKSASELKVKKPPLRERAQSYLCQVVQALVEAGHSADEDEVDTVNEMCMDMMSWLDDDDSIQDKEILRRIRRLKTKCDDIRGLSVPMDDIVDESESEDKRSSDVEEDRGNTSGRDSRKDRRDEDTKDKGDKATKDKGDKKESDYGDLPPLEEVF